MTSSKRNKTLFIDTEALSTLALVQEGLLHPVNKLMNKAEAESVDRSKSYLGVPFPFAFILAPNGEKNLQVLQSVTKGEKLDLICDGNHVGELIVEETFEIDTQERLRCIYGTTDTSHPGVKNTVMRMGHIAISGEYQVEYPLIAGNRKRISNMVQKPVQSVSPLWCSLPTLSTVSMNE